MAEPRGEIGSLRKGLRLLRLVNQFDGAFARDLAERVGINRTTAYRLLETMASEGYLSKDPFDHRYRATAKAARLSLKPRETGWHADVVELALAALAQNIPWPLSLATIVDGEVVVRHVTDAGTALVGRRIPSGSRLPLLGTAAGLVALAFAAPEERAILLTRAAERSERGGNDLARRSALVADDAALAARLERIAADGHTAFRQPGSSVRAIAVPLLAGGRVLAALSVRVIEAAMPVEEAVMTYVPRLKASAAAMAAAIVAQDAAMASASVSSRIE